MSKVILAYFFPFANISEIPKNNVSKFTPGKKLCPLFYNAEHTLNDLKSMKNSYNSALENCDSNSLFGMLCIKFDLLSAEDYYIMDLLECTKFLLINNYYIFYLIKHLLPLFCYMIMLNSSSNVYFYLLF